MDLLPLVPLFRFVQAVAHQAACPASGPRASHVGVASGINASSSHTSSTGAGQGAGRRADHVPGSTAGHDAVVAGQAAAEQDAVPGAPRLSGAPAGSGSVAGQNENGQGFPRVHVIDLDDDEVRFGDPCVRVNVCVEGGGRGMRARMCVCACVMSPQL